MTEASLDGRIVVDNLTKVFRGKIRGSTGAWAASFGVDETCIRVGGRWSYLYRAVDSDGETVLSD